MGRQSARSTRNRSLPDDVAGSLDCCHLSLLSDSRSGVGRDAILWFVICIRGSVSSPGATGPLRSFDRTRSRFVSRALSAATRSRRAPQVAEPVIDATPRGVCVRVLEGVERIGAGFHAQLKLLVGAVIAHENRDGVRVLCLEKRHLDASVLALGEHDSGGTFGSVIVRVVHVSPPVQRSQ